MDPDPVRAVIGGPAAEPQSELARAIALAAIAHGPQIDKSGKAYILHPLRVMQKSLQHGPAVQMVAVLHDVVEDTWVTLDHLDRFGFAPEVVEAVDAITQRKGLESYFDYIERCRANRIAAVVKLADLADNSDPVRRFGKNYEGMIERYRRARQMILDVIGPDPTPA